MKIVDLMELGRNYNFIGTYCESIAIYKFEEGFMYTLNQKTKEWTRPKITSYWLDQEFTVEKLTKREGK